MCNHSFLVWDEHSKTAVASPPCEPGTLSTGGCGGAGGRASGRSRRYGACFDAKGAPHGRARSGQSSAPQGAAFGAKEAQRRAPAPAFLMQRKKPEQAIQSLLRRGGVPGRIRTSDLWSRSPTLYPAELRVHRPAQARRLRWALHHYTTLRTVRQGEINPPAAWTAGGSVLCGMGAPPHPTRGGAGAKPGAPDRRPCAGLRTSLRAPRRIRRGSLISRFRPRGLWRRR